jgi:hypothetical protein
LSPRARGIEHTPKDVRRFSTHKSRLEIEKLIARHRPQVPIFSTIRQLPTRTASLVFTALNDAPTAADSPDTAKAVTGASPTLVVRSPARPLVVPLSPALYKIQFTASEETHVLLRRAQDLLRHQIPNGDLGEVVAKAYAAGGEATEANIELRCRAHNAYEAELDFGLWGKREGTIASQ